MDNELMTAIMGAMDETQSPPFKYEFLQVFVTPTVAEVLLERNTDNRKLNKQSVWQHKNDLFSNRFKFTPDPVVVLETGETCNGQHRLEAIVQSGVGAWMVIALGAPEAIKYVLDIGKPRTTGNILGFKGEANANLVGAIAKACLQYGEDPGWHHSKTHVVEHYESIKGQVRKYLEVGKMHRVGAASAAAFVLADLAGWRGVESASERFVGRSWSCDDDPMKRLHIRMVENKLDVKTRHTLTLSALNAVDDRRDIKVVRDNGKLVGDYKKGVRR